MTEEQREIRRTERVIEVQGRVTKSDSDCKMYIYLYIM